MRSSTSSTLVPSRERADAAEPRLAEVVTFIDAHLDGDLSVERLSKVARASSFHFHHRFSAFFGMAVHQYVKLARLRRAGLQLAFRHRMRVIDVALSAGYESPEAFARAFKRIVGQTPTAFREKPDWARFSKLDRRSSELRARPAWVSGEACGGAVSIELRAPIRTACLEVRGMPPRVGDPLRKMIAWRREQGLTPDRSQTYNLLYPPEEGGGIDLCVGTSKRIAKNAVGIIEKHIPGGRYAVARHVGTQRAQYDLLRWMKTDWLVESGEALGRGPAVIQRLRLFPDVPEHEAESEIALPLR